MARTYTHTATHQGLHAVSPAPLDDRLVVNSYIDLFDLDDSGSVFEEYQYAGMLVIVALNNNSFTDEKNGLYLLTRANYIQYEYDPNLPSDGSQDKNPTETVPGKSGKGGWKKLLSFQDLKFPEPDPDDPKEYVLKIYPNGTFNWEESTGGNGIPDPSDEDQRTYLTAAWNPATQEFDISWTRVSQGGNIPDPDRNGRLVLNVPDVTNPNTWSWVEEDTGKGIDIKGYPTQTDADGRWQPGPAEPLVNKNVLSNSGEVIAVPVDSEEDQSEDTNNPDRPFKLMLNYDEIPPLTIYGGNSEPEPDTCVFTANYYVSGGSGDPVFQDYMTGAVGSEITYTPVQSRTVGGVTYTLNSGQYAWTGTLTGTTADTVTYWVTAQAAWEPVAKYALMRATDGNIGEFPEFDVTNAGEGKFVLSSTAPNGTDSTPAQSPYKYFYLSAPIYSSDMFTQYGIAGILKLSDAQIAGADYWATGTSSEWRPFPQTSQLTFSYTALSGRNGEYRLSMETDGNASDIVPIRFKVQQ